MAESGEICFSVSRQALKDLTFVYTCISGNNCWTTQTCSVVSKFSIYCFM